MAKQVADVRNNIWDTNEILDMLEGKENMTAKEFVAKCILNVAVEDFDSIFEK